MINLSELRNEMTKAALELLEFWMKNDLDEENGGFYNVSCWNEVMPDSEKSATLNFRIFWTFSYAYLIYHDERYLRIADRAYNYVSEHFIDSEYGGIFPILQSDGTPIVTEKHGYVHSFAIAAFAAYYRASHNHESLAMAQQLFEKVEKCGKNQYHGYHDVCSRDWVPADKHTGGTMDSVKRDKSLRPNMHLLWGFDQLRQVQQTSEVDDAIERLSILLSDRMVDHRTWAAIQAFTGDWECVSDLEAYGDNFELAWILWTTLPCIKDSAKASEISQVCTNISNHSILSGVDREYGGVYQQFHHGKINTEKEWWVQAEAINGLFSAYCHTGEERYLEEAGACWTFVRDKMIRPDGTWIWKTKRAGKCFKAWEVRGPLMCPYHSGRMLLQSLELLETTLNKEINGGHHHE